MAARDWNQFARPAAPTRTLTPALAAALADLDRLARARPELAGAAGALSKVIRAAFLRPVPEPRTATHTDPALIVDAWRAGIPAFRAGDEPPAVDGDDLRARAASACEALDGQNPGAGPLLRAIRAGVADLPAWARDAMGDRPETVEDRAGALGLDGPLARSVLRLALLPALSVYSERLAELRPAGVWSRGDCPHCGGPPLLAESRGLEQRRYWRCGLCAAGWEGERLRCPFCGERDHRKLRYRFVDGEQDRQRLSLCDSCGGTLPVVSTLAPLSPPALLVSELALSHLDGLSAHAADG